VTTATSDFKAAAEGSLRAASPLHDIARAKVNLTLEIRGRRADGYHELESLVAFTRFGDRLMLEPGRPFSLEVTGPFASAIEGGNLIEKAAALHAAEEVGAGGTVAGARAPLGAFRLEKHIPVAAGLGGGSADAAAALRLLSEGGGGSAVERGALLPLAANLGADVPVCVHSRPAVMTGIGERLRLLPSFPDIPIVLVNPRQRLSTADVFRTLAAPPLVTEQVGEDLPAFYDIDDILAYAEKRSNDLEKPARRLQPVIGAVLDRLASCKGALLTRLSGSGPTCFTLFRCSAHAELAAAELARANPAWWIKETALLSSCKEY
jgi:4-diphosphocytidyl-2-C-methyl-D-erythritol kinase